MKKIYFTSDIHIDSNSPKIKEKFLKFLSNNANNMSELYILGDLFEYWIDDKKNIQDHDDVITCLKNLSKKINIYFQHGNRDFLIGNFFSQYTNIKILGNQHIIHNKNNKILIMHGDLLCTDDISYQRFRKIIRNKVIVTLIKILPYSIKTYLANFLRKKSENIVSQKPDYIMDVNDKTVVKYAQDFNTKIIIHGHTHRLNTHKYMKHGLTRYVLGDWHNNPSYITCDENSVELKKI